MGHHISALLLQGPFDEQRARSFGLKPVPLTSDITLFPLNASCCDAWSERLGINGWVSERPLLNHRVVHHLAREIAPLSLFAILETDYFGGVGEQAAAVYRADAEIMAPAVAKVGPINQALRHLGVQASPDTDAFDTLGLGRYRDLDAGFH